MPDLVIGGRRHGPQRTWRSAAIVVALLCAGVLVGYFIHRRVVSYVHPEGAVPDGPLELSEGPAGTPVLRFDGSQLSHVGRLAVLRLVGDAHTLGTSRGRLLGDAIGETAPSFAPVLAGTVDDDGFLGGLTYEARFGWRHRFLDDGVPGHQLYEIAGTARGANRSSDEVVGYTALLRQQAALDIGVAAPWSEGAAFRQVARSLSFVTTLRGASGDRLLIGRSFSLPGTADGGDAAGAHPVVSFIEADDAIPFASIGWPGAIGVVSGINAEGIAIMVHPARARGVRITRTAQPAPLLARDILEHARSLDDAIGALEQNEILGAAAFVIVDGNARRWAVVDRSPGGISVTRSPSPPVISDILRGEAFVEDPDNDLVRRSTPALAREKRVAQLLGARTIESPADAAAILRDHRGATAGPLPPGHRGAVHDPAAVHTAVFDASGMVLWVAEGPGGSGPMRAFDLRYELRGEGARPAPPHDIPPSEDADPAMDAAVRAARADLRAARRAWQTGRQRRGLELAQRALTRVPTMPEALRVAGDMAAARGDVEASRAYYRRYLDVGPDDPQAREMIEARLGGTLHGAAE